MLSQMGGGMPMPGHLMQTAFGMSPVFTPEQQQQQQQQLLQHLQHQQLLLQHRQQLQVTAAAQMHHAQTQDAAMNRIALYLRLW